MSFKAIIQKRGGPNRRSTGVALSMYATGHVVFRIAPDAQAASGLAPGALITLELGEGDDAGRLRIAATKAMPALKLSDIGGGKGSTGVRARAWPGLLVAKQPATDCRFTASPGALIIDLPGWAGGTHQARQPQPAAAPAPAVKPAPRPAVAGSPMSDAHRPAKPPARDPIRARLLG